MALECVCVTWDCLLVFHPFQRQRQGLYVIAGEEKQRQKDCEKTFLWPEGIQ